MRYEVVEGAGEWIVRRDGVEVGRFAEQGAALSHVADALRGSPTGVAAALAVRYARRCA